jgi:DNA-binding CsgD family transcriptional regulator
MSVRSRVVSALPALFSLLFVAVWWAIQAHEYAYSIGMRSDTFSTTPYEAAILVGFAVSCAAARWVPLSAFGLAAGMLVLQIAFWPARFSQTGWTAYLLLLLLAGELAAFASQKWRRLLLGGVIVLGLAVAVLLNLPSLSFSGQWGTINGKDWGSDELWIGWAAWSAVITVLVVLCWRAGAKFGRQAHINDEETEATATTRPDVSSLLTPREQQIFDLVGQGLTNPEIAATAHISVTTVKTHVAHILAKTHSSSRSKLIALAHHTTRSESAHDLA